jgi:hypothetical protein
VFIVFWNTQVTSSFSPTTIALAGLPSLQLTEVSVQPCVSASRTEYVPTSSCPVVRCPPSLRLKSNAFPFGRVNVKLKLVGSPSGSVCFWTMIFAPGFVAWTPDTPRNSTPSTIAAATKPARGRRNARFRMKLFSLRRRAKAEDPVAFAVRGSVAADLRAALYPPAGGCAITRTGR